MSVFLPNPTGSLGSIQTSAPDKSGELVAQGISLAVSTIVNLAFSSSIKKDQERFAKEINKLDSRKQEELLLKMQQVQSEIERQKIVFQYIDKQKIEELKNQEKRNKKYIYIALGAGILLYGLIILKLKKK
jgi:hypothetical protein